MYGEVAEWMQWASEDVCHGFFWAKYLQDNPGYLRQNRIQGGRCMVKAHDKGMTDMATKAPRAAAGHAFWPCTDKVAQARDQAYEKLADLSGEESESHYKQATKAFRRDMKACRAERNANRENQDSDVMWLVKNLE